MDLEKFRIKVHEYIKIAGYSTELLAKHLNTQRSILSAKLHGNRNLSHLEIRQIVEALARLEAITKKSQAIELLALVDCPDFSAARWNESPLNNLEQEEFTYPKTQPNPSLFDPILTTKFHIPKTRYSLLQRSRITVHFEEEITAKSLLLVTAPAGWGKTSLVSSWLLSSKFPAIWYSIDSQDNNEVRFLRHLEAAFAEFFKSQKQELGVIYNPQVTSPERFISLLLNHVTKLTSDFVLVLDDYQILTNDVCLNIVRFLLDHLPTNMHIVLLSRTTPDLPLVKLRANGQIIEIDENDLQFSLTEASSFLHFSMGLNLENSVVQILNNRTEGWVVGLQLIALSLKNRSIEQRDSLLSLLDRSSRFVLDYLTDEVLFLQTVEIQNFLLETSILEQLSDSLCNFIIGRKDSHTLLRQLERDNIFLIPLDDEHSWYRYHSLFAEALREKLGKLVGEERLNLLHIRASDWYKQNNQIEKAVKHAVLANDLSKAGSIIEEYADEVLKHGKEPILRGWLKIIPTEYVYSSPQLLIYLAMANFLILEYNELVRIAQAVENILQCNQDGNFLDLTVVNDNNSNIVNPYDCNYILAQLLIIKSYIARYTHDIEHMVSYTQRSLLLLPKNNWLRSEAFYTLSFGLYLKGDLKAATDCCKDGIKAGHASGNLSGVLTNTLNIAIFLTRQGFLRKSAIYLQQLLSDCLDSNGNYKIANIEGTLNYLGKIYYEWNDFDSSIHYFKQVLGITESNNNFDMMFEAYAELAKIERAKGNIQKAKDIWILIEELYPSSKSSATTKICLSRKARFDLQIGDLYGASYWAVKSGLNPDDDYEELVKRAAEYIILASVYFHQGKLHLATELLQRLLDQAQTGGYRNREIQILLLKSQIYYQEGKIEQALNTLVNLLIITEPEGYIRTIIDEGPIILDLLKLFISNKDWNISISVEEKERLLYYTNRLLSAFGTIPTVSRQIKAG